MHTAGYARRKQCAQPVVGLEGARRCPRIRLEPVVFPDARRASADYRAAETGDDASHHARYADGAGGFARLETSW